MNLLMENANGNISCTRKGHGGFTTTNVDHLADIADMHNSSVLKEQHCYTDGGGGVDLVAAES